MELKCNPEGRRRFIELTELGYEIMSMNGTFYLYKVNHVMVELSQKFSDLLLKKGIIEKI